MRRNIGYISNISVRTVIGFLAMAVLLVIVNVVGIYYINYIQGITEKVMAENLASVIAARELQMALVDQKGLTTNFLLTEDASWLQKFDQAKATFEDWFRKAKDSAHTPQEFQTINEIRRAYQAYLEVQQQVIALFMSDRLSDAYDLRNNHMVPALETTIEQCQKFWDLNEAMMKQGQEKLAHSNTKVKNLIKAMMIGGILLGLFLGIVIARSITKPIYELVLKVRSVTEKEGLLPNVELANEGELEQLGRGVRQLIDKVYRINEELARNQQVLIRSERLAAAGELAAGVAHEILNPLTTVKMLTYAREEELPPDASQREDLRMIISEIDRMEGVLRSFLDFARVPEPEFNTVALMPTIENALALLQPEMRKRAVHPTLHIAQDVIIHADRSQITQVLVNLFRNAMDAMPKGGDLGITTRPMEFLLDSTKRMVQIEISDTGAGIPDHLLPRLFDPFVTGKNGGTGLGLSIAYKIVEIHGGWIEAKNNYHGGAVFTVVLPMEA